MEMEEMITGLDIGSTKITAVMGAKTESGEIQIFGVGTCPSEGVKNGSIVNIEACKDAISTAIQDAELMAGFDCDKVIVNITGKTMSGDNSRGVIAISNKDRIVGQEEVLRVVEAAQAIRMPADQEIIHVLAREFIVDDQTSIKDPLGMTGIRLEANVHIVTAGMTAVHNLEKAVNLSGLSVQDKILSSLASAESVLTEGEKELGVALIDIGSGIVDIVIYFEGGVCFTKSIPLGAYYITQDISIGLRIPMEYAEVLKKKYGVADIDMVDPNEEIEIPSVGNRQPRTLQRQELAQIIKPRMKEILELVDVELLKSGKKSFLAGGVVLTGGGALLGGSVALAESVLNLGVSVGTLKSFVGLTDKVASPDYATAVGLVAYGIKSGAGSKRKKRIGQQKESWRKRIKIWLEENL